MNNEERSVVEVCGFATWQTNIVRKMEQIMMGLLIAICKSEIAYVILAGIIFKVSF